MQISLFACDEARPWLERRTRTRLAKLARDRSRACPEIRPLDALAQGVPVWLLRAGASPLDLPDPLPDPSGKALLAIGPVESFGTPRQQAVDHELFRTSSDLSPFFAKATAEEARAAMQSVSSLYTNRPEELLSEGVAGIPAKLAHWAQSRRVRMFVHPGLAVRQSDELRVALLLTTLHRGGAERIALDLHAHAPRYGASSLLLVLDAPKRATFPIPKDTLEIHRVPKADRLDRTLEKISEEGIDVAHAHLLSADWLSRLSAEPVLIAQTLHNAEKGWPEGIQNVPVDLSIACSRGVEQDWRRGGKSPVRTVWNGISPMTEAGNVSRMDVRASVRAARAIPSGTRVLLSVANIRPQKNLEELPAILRGLLERGIDAILVLVGERVSASAPSEMAEQALIDAILREDVSGRVIRVGSIDRVVEEYAAADVLVSSALHEGLSLVHLEALQAGLPIVVREAHGVSEIRERHPDRVMVVGQEETLDAMVEALVACFAREPDRLGAVTNGSSADTSPLSSAFSVHAMAEGNFRLLRSLATAGRQTPSGSGQHRGTLRRVLFVTNNLVTGGAQSSLKRLVVELKRRGHSVGIALLEEHPHHPSHGRTELESRGMPVKVLGPTSKNSAEGIALGLVQTAAAMDAEAVVFWNAIVPVKVAFAEIGFPYRIYDVSPGEMYFRSLETFFVRSPLGNIDSASRYGARLSGAIVKYEREIEEASRVLGTKVHVVPNGLPLADGQRSKGSKEQDARPFVIGTVSRISPDKRLEELIEAFRYLVSLLPHQPLELHMVGGPDRHQEDYWEALKERSKDLPVRWRGEILPATDCLQGFDLFAMISEPAGCPNASLEAMGAGLPIVATDHGGAAEQIVHGESGLITPRGNPEELAKGLALLVKDGSLRERMGRAAMTRIQSHFSIDRMVDAYIEVLQGESST